MRKGGREGRERFVRGGGGSGRGLGAEVGVVVVVRNHFSKGGEGCCAFGGGGDGDVLEVLERREGVFIAGSFFGGLEGLERGENGDGEFFSREGGRRRAS